jgi:2-C-methyl-D-erythritol 4-phosphate cytidylyltransferase
MAKQPRVHALIPAAGRSVRFGGTTLKQYAHLMGLPVIAHSIDALRRNRRVASVTVALAPDDGIYDELLRPDYPDVRTIVGGDFRAQTVMNGLESIMADSGDADWVLVHDAARPCLSQKDLDRLLDEGLDSEAGAILAVPVHDTLKRSDEARHVQRTVDRTHYWAAQTPQFFPVGKLADNLASALRVGRQPTDESAAMEYAGIHALLVQGSPTNIKITGPEDLALAEFILRHQSVRET